VPSPFKLLASIGAVVAATCLARAADAPDARALLDGVSRTYRSLSSFHFAGRADVDMVRQGAPQSFHFPLVAAAAKPGRWRIDMQSPSMGMVMVADGKTVTTYSEQLNQYTRKSAPAARGGATDSAGAMAGPGSPIARYFGITRSLKSARWLGTRTLDLDGRPTGCDLVAAEYEHPPNVEAVYSPTVFWIEKGRSVVLRESTHVRGNQPGQGGEFELSQTTTFTTARINEKLPESLFAFRPPAGATKVARFGNDNTPDLSGKKAEDFTLSDLDGKPVKLSSLRGKVVLLDFWATWCGPCRIEMPSIQKLHREFKTRGLIVLGINYGEEEAKVRPYLIKNGYDFRILLDRQQAVGQRYQVSGIPALFIIDRAGTIRSHFVGVRDEDTLREALAEAGIK
jgi:peroxiredoxin/outer membrane lipoprotein-sorting protein